MSTETLIKTCQFCGWEVNQKGPSMCPDCEETWYKEHKRFFEQGWDY